MRNDKDLGHLNAKSVPRLFVVETTEIAIYLRKSPYFAPFNPPIFAFFLSKNVKTGTS